MSTRTKIAWADSTWNPWIGCTKVSPGCANCYAADYGRRFGVEWGPGKPRRRTSAAYWKKPLAWNKSLICGRCGASEPIGSDDCRECQDSTLRPRRIFPSLCDPFDPEVPIEWLADFLDLIRRTPNLTWLLLTKRPQHWAALVKAAGWQTVWCEGSWFPNLWLGVSAEDQARWDERVPVLLSIPAAKRFVSVEPMLGHVQMRPYLSVPKGFERKPLGLIDWVIFGGESGRNARPCNIEWIRDGLRQCREAGVKCFVKQLGAKPGNSCGECGVVPLGTLPHNRPWDDPSEWPADLRVREVT